MTCFLCLPESMRERREAFHLRKTSRGKASPPLKTNAVTAAGGKFFLSHFPFGGFLKNEKAEKGFSEGGQNNLGQTKGLFSPFPPKTEGEKALPSDSAGV